MSPLMKNRSDNYNHVILKQFLLKLKSYIFTGYLAIFQIHFEMLDGIMFKRKKALQYVKIKPLLKTLPNFIFYVNSKTAYLYLHFFKRNFRAHTWCTDSRNKNAYYHCFDCDNV